MKKAILTCLFMICLFALSSCGLFGGKEEEIVIKSAELSAEISGDGETPQRRYTVAVLMPNNSERKWALSADAVTESLEDYGYGVIVYFAEDDARIQAEQIAEAKQNRSNCIIITAVDSYSQETIAALESVNLPVIAYERLIANTESVTCFVAFDPYLSGRLCAQSVIEASASSAGTLNIEVFSPPASNGSAKYFYHGAMDILMPYIDSGRINIPSGRLSFEETELGEKPAKQQMDAILGEFYPAGRKLDAVIAPEDASALGIIKSLEEAGYGRAGKFPYVTGSDCDLQNIFKIMDGQQLISLFKDERVIGDTLAETADFASHNISPGNADETTYNNGKTVVPALLLEPVPANIDNYKEVLIGSDYYNYKDIQRE